jgi:hypothetical protein
MKTKWIGMLSSMCDGTILITKMHDDVSKHNTTNQHLNLLCDLDLPLGLHVSYLYILIKFAQFHNMFVILLM